MIRSILFVCLGNICRSPLGEGVLRSLAGDTLHIDSAGTSGYHEGDPPDSRMAAVAEEHGISLDGQRSRPVRDEDFEDFDLILAMDRENLQTLRRRAPVDCRAEIRLLRDFDPAAGDDVPDPYYGGPEGFEEVFEIVHRSCTALLEERGGA